jgi:hypothetical protein
MITYVLSDCAGKICSGDCSNFPLHDLFFTTLGLQLNSANHVIRAAELRLVH